MSKIVIGKYTLESLTSGMYADPFVLYREYTQNAVDSIDNAYKKGILLTGQEQINISIFPIEKRIEIFDNGIGIEAQKAEQTLTGIGNSKKDALSTRGFRGIGRLSALSYCQTLKFETSYPGEPLASILTIDALKLNEILTTKSTDHDISVEAVMKSICFFEQYEAISAEHYFKVTMYGIDPDSNLLKTHLVKEYLEQVAPVPFNVNEFSWSKEIIRRIGQAGYKIPQYRIQINCTSETSEILKPYQDTLLVDKVRNLSDSIQDVIIQEIYNSENQIMAIVWFAQTNFIGTIVDKSVKGLRMRKGNLLIGDGQTLNTLFKDARFNGWTIGEAYILDPKLLPNARRDNFEKTKTYFMFTEKMTAFASDITKQIRSASLKRNAELQAAIKKTELVSEAAQNALEQSNLSSQEKGKLTYKLHSTQKKITSINTGHEADKLLQEIAFEQLDMLIGKVQGATTYKAINLINSLSKTEKKILEKVFHVLQSQLSDSEMQKITDALLVEFINIK